MLVNNNIESISEFLKSLEKRIYHKNDFEIYDKKGCTITDISKRDKQIELSEININSGFDKINFYIVELIENQKELHLNLIAEKVNNLNEYTNEKYKELRHPSSKINSLYLISYYSTIINQTEKILEYIENVNSLSLPATQKKTASNDLPKWFPIGLGFANGEIRKKLKTMSANEIVKEYNLENYQNYVTSTGIAASKDPKNIYSDLKKLNLVNNYCIKNDINICVEFQTAYQKKKDEMN
jgi:hypothetical protein